MRFEGSTNICGNSQTRNRGITIEAGTNDSTSGSGLYFLDSSSYYYPRSDSITNDAIWIGCNNGSLSFSTSRWLISFSNCVANYKPGTTLTVNKGRFNSRSSGNMFYISGQGWNNSYVATSTAMRGCDVLTSYNTYKTDNYVMSGVYTLDYGF